MLKWYSGTPPRNFGLWDGLILELDLYYKSTFGTAGFIEGWGGVVPDSHKLGTG